ncbi:MAG: RNA 2',3'-cyclic phosphodiesterase [Bacillota bacterium]|jgi:2'-5' RNA ligase
MNALRLFWAVNPPGGLKAELGRFQSGLQNLPVDMKWVEQENLHLTVKFLGGVDCSVVPVLTRAVSGSVSGLAPFTLELAGWGTFGRPPRVLWIGVGGALERFRELWVRVDRVLVPLGFPAEKSFSPHLTLGRLRSARNAAVLRERAQTLAAARGSWGSFTVDRVDLMQSTLTREGPVYRVVATVPLSGGSGQNQSRRVLQNQKSF